MIQFVSLLWVLALFWAVFGFLRGWYREIVVTGGIIAAMFVLVQVDFLLRGIFLVRFSRDSVFIIQLIIFGSIIYAAAVQQQGTRSRQRTGTQAGIIGALVGALNGYLVGTTLWYFLDINEYPFSTFITPPAPGSASAEMIASLPIVLLNGGLTGSGEFFVLTVIVVIVVTLAVL